MHHQCCQNCQNQEKSDFTDFTHHPPDLIYFIICFFLCQLSGRLKAFVANFRIMLLPRLAFNTTTLRKSVVSVGLLGQHRASTTSNCREAESDCTTDQQRPTSKVKRANYTCIFYGTLPRWYQAPTQHLCTLLVTHTWTHNSACMHTHRHRFH